ncbi:MAG: hypothetical protein J0H94_20955 [Rhizobiales bacterium]|nr:hypothetical protein [Hyphomicrobiales bacterium]
MKPINLLVLVISLLAVALVIWWDWQVFSEIGMEMPTSGWVALILGVVFSIIVGCGLMFLVFYSSRRGYDEGPERDDSPSRDPNE